MLDVDLGPALNGLFLVLFIFPGLVGLLVGIGVGKLITRKSKISKAQRLILVFVMGIFFAILFPTVTIQFSKWQTENENRKFAAKERQYVEQNLINFRLEKASFSNKNLKIFLNVPRKGKYRIMVYMFKENKPESVFNRWAEGVDLENGNNILSVNLSTNDISIKLPANFAMAIQNFDDTYALRNTRRSVTITNTDSVIKKEGVIYYSDDILTDKQDCPVFNYLEWLPCAPNPLLRIN